MKNVREMGLNQWNEFSVALQKAGFNADLVQQVISSKDNKLAQVMYDALVDSITSNEIEERFKLINTFTLTTPSNLEEYFAPLDEKYASYSDTLVANFPGYQKGYTYEKLKAETAYQVKVFLTKNASFDECMEKLISEKALLVGGQGMMLAIQLKGNDFSTRAMTLGTVKDVVWMRRENYASGLKGSGKHWRNAGGSFERDRFDEFHLLCFCEI